MTGNGKHSTHKHGDDWGVVYGIVLTTIYMCVCVREQCSTSLLADLFCQQVLEGTTFSGV